MGNLFHVLAALSLSRTRRPYSRDDNHLWLSGSFDHGWCGPLRKIKGLWNLDSGPPIALLLIHLVIPALVFTSCHCFALVVVFVVIFAILGIAYGFLAATMAIQRIWQRHYHILTKRELTKVIIPQCYIECPCCFIFLLNEIICLKWFSYFLYLIIHCYKYVYRNT